MIIEKIRQQPLLQIVWSAVLLAVYVIYFIQLSDQKVYSLSPFIDQLFFDELSMVWKGVYTVLTLLVLVAALFQLSKLLRDYHFSGDSRAELMFLLPIVLLLYPQILAHLELAILVLLMVYTLSLQFRIHTQISIRGELAMMGFLMSLATLAYLPSVLIMILLYVGVLFQRGFCIKELFIYLVIYLLPFYLIWAVLKLMDHGLHFNMEFDGSNLLNEGLDALWISRASLLIVFSFFLVLSYLKSGKDVLRSKAQFRNFHLLIYLGLVFYYFLGDVFGLAISLLSVFAIFIRSYSTIKKNWIVDLVLVLIFLSGLFQILMN